MNDGVVPANGTRAGEAQPPLLAFAFAPLLVKTLTIRCKVMPEANPWLEQAAREVNQVCNFANATSYEALHSYTTRSLPPSDPNAKPRGGKKAKTVVDGDHVEPDKVKKEKTPGQKKWLSAFDLNRLVAGCGELFDKIGIDVAQKVNAEYVHKRTQSRKTKLRFRASGGSKRALGWVPFKAANIRQNGNSLTFCGKRIGRSGA